MQIHCYTGESCNVAVYQLAVVDTPATQVVQEYRLSFAFLPGVSL